MHMERDFPTALLPTWHLRKRIPPGGQLSQSRHISSESRLRESQHGTGSARRGLETPRQIREVRRGSQTETLHRRPSQEIRSGILVLSPAADAVRKASP